MFKLCENCNNEHDGLYGSGRFCKQSCSRSFSTKSKRKEINKKVSETLKIRNFKEKVNKICKNCNDKFDVCHKKRNQQFCCKSCSSTYINNTPKRKEINRKAGLKSANIQRLRRRSKNEIYFAELCLKQFKNVSCNEQIFNGWDADVIIHDIKYAVLWNGAWHYKKITDKHSVEQVQNREKIKLKEINNYGYTSYIIKDLGKFNKAFVEHEFDKFLQMLALTN